MEQTTNFKHLIFQVLFFFHKILQNSLKNLFQVISYFFIKLQK
jgi:hypothetical protein